MNRFVLDFYCSKLLLAVEIDGDSHDNKKYYDNERDQMLKNVGIITIRFRNEIVLNNVDLVIDELLKVMEEREVELLSPPLYSKRG